MPVTWHLEDSGCLVVTGRGAVTDAEYLEAHRGFFAATAHQAGPRRSLADWTGVTAMLVTSDAVKASVGLTGSEMSQVGTGHRIALVAASPVVYGMCRMWQTLIGDSGIEAAVFHTCEEARAWLAS